MGYCSRCGDVVHGDISSRCRCGGLVTTAKSSQVLSEGRPVTPEGSDRWQRQYITRSPSSTPKGGTVKSGENNNNYFDNKTVQRTASRTSKKTGKHLSLPMMSPSLEQQCEETISRAFGSVLDPQNKRAKWACAACDTMFVRDQTVYPDPRAKDNPSLGDTLYCPGCFADRFSLGDCVKCGASVLPDAAAPFIARKDKLWHAVCYSCLYCDKDLSKSPQVDLYGNPCCSRCFDTAAFLKAPTVERVPALLSANEPDSLQDVKTKPTKPRFVKPEAARLGPAVNELRSRLEKAGLEKGSDTAVSVKQEGVKSPKFGGNYSFRLPPPSPRMELKKSQFDNQPSSGHPPPSPRMEPRSPHINSQPLHSRHLETNHSVPAVEAHSGPAAHASTSPKTQLKSPTFGQSQGYFTQSQSQCIAAPSSALAKSAVAPPMLRSRSDVPASSTTPSWQRHRLAQSVTTLPDASGASASTKPPPSPVMAQIARFETPNGPSAIHEPSKLFTRPQRTGRTQSLFNVPTISQISSTSTASGGNPALNRNLGKKVSVADLKKGFDGPSVSKAAYAVKQETEISKPILRPKASQADLPKHPEEPNKHPQTISANHPSGKAASPPSSILSPDSRCTGCQLRLFSIGASASDAQKNKVITLPESGENYHARCFVCGICKAGFEEGSFVELEGGRKVHEKCAPPLRADFTQAPLPSSSTIPIPSKPRSEQLAAPSKPFRTSPSITSLQQQHSSAVQVAPLSPSKIQIKVKPSTGPTKLSKASEVFASSNRGEAGSRKSFGGMYSCAGCGEGATMAETTLGPVGTRFHHRCLKCACGKKLDIGAKSLESVNENGEMKPRFACRDCIDKDRLAKRSLSSVSGLNALRGRI